MTRSFLALQGTASHFFSRLSEGLIERGHSARRINFCGGDLLYSTQANAWNYAGSISDLPNWYSEVLNSGGYSDILLFGDCRAIHRPVHNIAKQMGVNVHVFEEGYVRPHWLTLEKHGVNGRSLLPRDPKWYLDGRVPTPSPGLATGYNLYERAWHDIRYRMGNAILASRFPGYESHRPYSGAKEYAALAQRFAHQKRYRDEAARATSQILKSRRSYYLFPLQLNSDTQITVHSPFTSVREAIERVMRSLAEHAPADASLVIKNHPLDTGLVEYRRFVQQLAATLDLTGRIVYIEAGHLPTLLEHARGVIVVNSTVGLSALHHRRPLMALGDAIYKMQGMTWGGDLNDFWTQAHGPDMNLYYAFLDYVIHHTQINGDFYTRTGIEMAVQGAIRKLEQADG